MNPWDAPPSFPNRPGDESSDEIHSAVGSALHEWEAIEVALAWLVAILTAEDTSEERLERNPHALKFGRTKGTRSRVKMLQKAGDDFLKRQQGPETTKIGSEITSLVAEYEGWAGRRNEVAHGHVTESISPDYSQEDQPLIKTFSLCPSHGNADRWDIGRAEPEYNYNAKEIRSFAEGFRALAKKTDELVMQIRTWKRQASGG